MSTKHIRTMRTCDGCGNSYAQDGHVSCPACRKSARQRREERRALTTTAGRYPMAAGSVVSCEAIGLTPWRSGDESAGGEH